MDVGASGGSNGRVRRGGFAVVPDNTPRSEKNVLKPWLKKQWCIAPKKNVEFVWHMEDVLDVYKHPYDARIRLKKPHPSFEV